MKRTLVMSGGGSRGAYEIGAWQALTELGVRFSAVYGTSIGAINAGLVAQGDLETAVQLWSTINITQVLETEDEDFSVDHLVHNKRDILPFLLENAKKLHMDITPLRKLVADCINETRIRTSGMDLGIMTVAAPQMRPRPMRLKDMREGTLGAWLIASASCFPVFPIQHIDGQGYIDGGFFDNMPIDMALADGADEIVAVDIHPSPVHPEYKGMPFLRLIHPLHDLGGFLDFTPALLRRGRLLGYYDTMKSYGGFDGIRYTFTRRNELDVAYTARAYTRAIASFDASAIERAAFRSSEDSDAPLITAIQCERPLYNYSWKDVLLRGLELCAETMGFREDAVYDADILTQQLIEYIHSDKDSGELTEHGIKEAAAAGSRRLIVRLVKGLRRDGELPENIISLLAKYPKETAAALYLHCAENN